MRCNLIAPDLLTDQHLIAERRELLMIPPLAKQRLSKSINTPIPIHFTLNKGHMLFFTNKLKYLSKRFDELTQTMLIRQFKPNLNLKFEIIPDFIEYNLYQDWSPTQADYEIIMVRLKTRIQNKFEWYKYYSKPITQDWFRQHYVDKYN